MGSKYLAANLSIQKMFNFLNWFLSQIKQTRIKKYNDIKYIYIYIYIYIDKKDYNEKALEKSRV